MVINSLARDRAAAEAEWVASAIPSNTPIRFLNDENPPQVNDAAIGQLF
jgi:hypothetical protein